MFTRRSFLSATSAVAATGVSLRAANTWAWALPDNDPYLAKIGIQLYTLRNEMAKDPVKTLGAVADAGYKQIELMDVMDATQLMPIAKDKGLYATSAFLKWNILGETNPAADVTTLEQSIEQAQKHNIKYLVFGYIGKGNRERADQLKATAERSNKAGEKCKSAGIQLCYHHHSFEFQPLEGGKTGMDIFIETFDKELVKFEIDIFWAAIGGWDPVQTLEKLAGRVAQVHLKDLLPKTPNIFDEGKVPKEAFKEVGAGGIDIKSVLAVSKKIGVEQCHVEQDQSPEPVQSIQLSISNLRKI
jgi:sugar phosphate isomerase/epimerase